MLTNELMSIEVIFRHLVKNSSLSSEVQQNFSSPEDFDFHKTNLFNLIIINELLQNYTDNPSFSLESFLDTGIIPKEFEDKTTTPSIVDRPNMNYKDFYRLLIKALRNNNYIFEEDNNIYISTEELETSIPQIWLYRLTQAFKRGKENRLYFYNKVEPKQIKNKEELIEFLRHTKSFLITTTSLNPNADYNKEYNCIKEQITSLLKDKKEIKVNDIMELYQKLSSPTFKVSTSYYKVKDNYWLIRRIERMGKNFYDLPYTEQERILNNLLIEHYNSNELANKETQNYILRTTINNIYHYDESTINKDRIIIGLFNLYMNTLYSMNPDLTSISLTSFKIKEYTNNQNVNDKKEKKDLEQKLVKLQKEIDELINITSKLLSEIEQISLQEGKLLNKKKEEYAILEDQYREKIRIKEQLLTEKNNLDSKIHNESSDAFNELAFDNERIMALIIKSIQEGRVYLNNNEITIEIYDKALSNPIFKATISINNFLEFIENINYSLEEYIPSKHYA